MKNFSLVLGYLDIVIRLDTYKNVVEKYVFVKEKLEEWVFNYCKNNNFDSISTEASKKIYNILDSVREEILFDKLIGNEKKISDEILIWYEILIKKINEERGKNREV